MNSSAVILIPIYKKSISHTELISLTQVKRVLNRWPLYFIGPKNLDYSAYRSFEIPIETFEDHYFENIEGYNRLLLSKELYERFILYEYALLAQLDTFVFRDELNYWCRQGYTFIGAPWTFNIRKYPHTYLRSFLPLSHKYKYLYLFRKLFHTEHLVGNGGFSLRNIRKCYFFISNYQVAIDEYLKKISHLINMNSDAKYNEDVFWCLIAPKVWTGFKIPKFRTAVSFAFESNPRYCYRKNRYKLPFGCHAWEKHSIEFWKPIIESYGYSLYKALANPLNEKATGCVDMINNFTYKGGRINIYEKKMYISGWFIDESTQSIPNAVYFFIGDLCYKAKFGIMRLDIADLYMNPNLGQCGFSVTIPVKEIGKGKQDIQVKVENNAGTGYYSVGNILVDIKSNPIACFFKSIRKQKKYFKGFIKKPFFLPSLFKNLVIMCLMKVVAKIEKRHFVVINLDEHIGDIVACEPVSRIIRMKYPNGYIVWITKYKYWELIAWNKNINSYLCVTCLYEWMCIKHFNLSDITIDLHIDKRRCTSFDRYLENPNQYGITLDNYYFHGSLLEAFMMAANLEPQNIGPNFHFKPNLNTRLPKNIIVFQCTANEEDRQWPVDNYRELALRLLEKGYTISEVGLRSVLSLKHPQYIDFCRKLSLQQIAVLIKNARLFIGSDSAFAHFANATGAEGVILLGRYRLFDHYLPYSGDFANGSRARILYSDGEVSRLKIDTVYTAVIERLNTKK